MSQSLARETAVSFVEGRRIAWPDLLEAALVIVAVAVLFPWFERVAADDAGRDRRFAEAVVTVRGLPPPALPSLCSAYGAFAEPLVRERLCRHSRFASTADWAQLPAALTDARRQVRAAFLAPLRETETRLADLRLQQREGLGDLLVLSNAIEATEAELQPFVSRYVLDGPEGTGPTPLECAFEKVEGALGRGDKTSSQGDKTSSQGDKASSQGDKTRSQADRTPFPDITRANALLLLGAAIDGHPATPALADAALLAADPARDRSRCGGWRMSDALAQASVLMADARQAPTASAKNDAMRGLLRTAGWQWAGWMLLGYGLVQLARRSIAPAYGIALSLAAWALAAWVGRVPWPLASERAFVPGREGEWWFSMPAPFVLWMLGAALCVVLASASESKKLPAGPETMASRIGYPGLVVATGIGFLLLLDLSANGHTGNRYLALYHQGHLWLGLTIFSVVTFLRQPIGRLLGWCLSVVDGVTSAIGSRVRTVGAVAVSIVVMLAIVGGVGFLLANIRQLTSELGRVWLIVGASWFFFLRGTPLAERLARSDRSFVSLVRYVAPLLFVVLVLVGTMVITRDMGPLLIAGYGAGAFVAASIAMWWHQRHRAAGPAFAIAIALFVAWVLGTTTALFELGSIDDVTAARLENLAAPMASANDQLALVSWFQSASPPTGFGLGNVPWCGYSVGKGCAGVPAQIQSDYTFTALVGAFGWTFAWAMTIGTAIWLHRLVRHHGRVTRGEPRLVASQGRVVNDDQAFLSWLAVTWVVLALCQLAVTVAGNLAVLPLTGVTFPFVSFGMTSLLVNMAMLGLTLHINVPERAFHG